MTQSIKFFFFVFKNYRILGCVFNKNQVSNRSSYPNKNQVSNTNQGPNKKVSNRSSCFNKNKVSNRSSCSNKILWQNKQKIKINIFYNKNLYSNKQKFFKVSIIIKFSIKKFPIKIKINYLQTKSYRIMNPKSNKLNKIYLISSKLIYV